MLSDDSDLIQEFVLLLIASLLTIYVYIHQKCGVYTAFNTMKYMPCSASTSRSRSLPRPSEPRYVWYVFVGSPFGL